MSDDICPTCGQAILSERYAAATAAQLVAALKERPRGMIYRFADQYGWGMTHGGKVHPQAVHDAVAAKLIRPCYSNAPRDAYWLGQTIDVDASLALRAKTGRRDAAVYV